MSVVTQVIFALNGIVELMLMLLRAFGSEFVNFFCEALEKPWLVKR